MYKRAATAQLYYSTNNEAVGKRMGYLERQMQRKVNIIFHKLRMAFFPKSVKRLVLYLMGNGATIDDEIKLQIDRKFDNKMIISTIYACVDGVVWGFPDLNEEGNPSLTFFRATEFVPLFDERTSKLMAGIRFWQIAPDKPIYIEFYEINGMTEFKIQNGSITELEAKRAYKNIVRKDSFSTDILSAENYDILPIVPLYANELGTSELTTGLKSLIDAYDFISSDLVDTITLIEGLYWIIKNFGGENVQQLLAELQTLKASLIDGSDTAADSYTVEAPFQAKQMALDLLEKRMHSDWLMPSDGITGAARGVTATEIKANREPLDMKADILEWQVAEFIENILKLKGLTDLTVGNFKRRTSSNDTETINNIATQLSGGWIDEEEAIELDPTINTERKEDLLKRIELLNIGALQNEEDNE